MMAEPLASLENTEFPKNSINHYHEPDVRITVRLTTYVYDN